MGEIHQNLDILYMPSKQSKSVFIATAEVLRVECELQQGDSVWKVRLNTRWAAAFWTSCRGLWHLHRLQQALRVVVVGRCMCCPASSSCYTGEIYWEQHFSRMTQVPCCLSWQHHSTVKWDGPVWTCACFTPREQSHVQVELKVVPWHPLQDICQASSDACLHMDVRWLEYQE